jgi:hypothetical protein
VKLWKRELQRLADAIGLKISVTHLPPGTSKWNKIEHRVTTRCRQSTSCATISTASGLPTSGQGKVWRGGNPAGSELLML